MYDTHPDVRPGCGNTQAPHPSPQHPPNEVQPEAASHGTKRTRDASPRKLWAAPRGGFRV